MLHISKQLLVLPALVLAFFAAPAFCQTGHVHQLHYNNSTWADKDLTALTGGGAPSAFGAITAFYTTPNYQLHVYYVDANLDHVHQLYFNGSSWSDEDLTSFTGGPTASPYAITGFAVGNLQYIFYVGLDNHVHEISYNNYDWGDQDLTATVGGTQAGFGPVLAFTTQPGSAFHVYYQEGGNLDLHQLFFNGGSWSDSDLTAMTGASCYSDWLAGFAIQNQQHVFCPGYGTYSSNLDMMHLYYNNVSWVYEDLTYRAGGFETPMALGSGVSAFFVPNGQSAVTMEVFGITSDTHVHQFSRVNGKWANVDLTSSIGAPADGSFGGLAAFRTTPNDQFHAYYAPGTEVYQLYFNGTNWTYEDLTNGVGVASGNGGMAGFSLGNLQYLFYIGE